jgi:hypothetical protein
MRTLITLLRVVFGFARSGVTVAPCGLCRHWNTTTSSNECRERGPWSRTLRRSLDSDDLARENYLRPCGGANGALLGVRA